MVRQSDNGRVAPCSQLATPVLVMPALSASCAWGEACADAQGFEQGAYAALWMFDGPL